MVRLNARIAGAGRRSSLSLDNGERLTGTCVIDGRGPAPSPALALAFQKFVGLEVRLAAPHGETVPVIMDAAVSQSDGYRFVYTLPFSADTILIEDTYYADGPTLEPETLRATDRGLCRLAGLAASRRSCARKPARCRSCWAATSMRSGARPAAEPPGSACAPDCSIRPPATRFPMRSPSRMRSPHCRS